MKKKDFNNLKTKDINELNKLVDEKKIELIKAKAAIIASKEKNLKLTRNTRLDISRILTLIKEKQISETRKEK